MPFIKTNECTHCMKCVTDCPSSAIDIQTGFIATTCIHCGHCVAICPVRAVNPDEGEIISLEKHQIDSNRFRTLSASIRTCRNYTNKHVPAEVINELIKNMKHYPSASNARKVEIVAIASPEIITELNNNTLALLIKTLKIITSFIVRNILNVIAPSINLKQLERYKAKFIKMQDQNSSQICHNAPLVFLFHGPVSLLSKSEADAMIWATYTSIYANTLGLGTCFNGFITEALARSSKLRKKLGIPAKRKVYAALLLGYPNVKYLHETSRKSPEYRII
jgi:ferredoxin